MSESTFICRTNYFKVKDAEAFRRELHEADVLGMGDSTLTEDASDGTFLLCFYDGEPEIFPEEDDDEPTTVKQLVAAHLVEGEVAIFLEIYADGMRSIGAGGTIVSSSGEQREVDFMDDLVNLASTMGHVSSDFS